MQYVNDDQREYIPYDYSYSEDIFPAINNLFPDIKKLEIKRPLKNVRVFLEGSIVGICFKGFDFNDIDSVSLMMEATSSPDVDAVYFINCRFNTSCGIDLPSASAGYYDCEFNEPKFINKKGCVLANTSFFVKLQLPDKKQSLYRGQLPNKFFFPSHHNHLNAVSLYLALYHHEGHLRNLK